LGKAETVTIGMDHDVDVVGIVGCLRAAIEHGAPVLAELNLQSEYDIRVADRELRAKLSPRIRVFRPVAG